MKIVLGLLSAIAASWFYFSEPAAEVVTFSSKPVAVIELFTSEGCSSCPPAEVLLDKMTRKYQDEGKDIYPLAFHVTYWNKQWKDPFSQELFTERQRRYSRALNINQLYTPQAIVNGNLQFVGSNAVAFVQTVDSALQYPMPYHIQATAKKDKDFLTIQYTLGREPKNNGLMNVAIAQDFIENNVVAGENQGRSLHHHHVVRNFITRDLKQRDTIVVAVPEGVGRKDINVVLYAQQRFTMEVLGALKIKIQ